jgi:hypothetical protein
MQQALHPRRNREARWVLRELRVMATIVFNFFKANVKDDSVLPFIKKIEEILKTFAGEAYHFRYYLEEPQNTTERKTPKNGLKGPNINRQPRFR